MNFRRASSAFVLLGAFAALPFTSHGMSVLAPTFPELVQESAVIVRGRVTEVASRKVATPRGEAIKTFVTFEVSTALKGSPGRTVTFAFLGGTVDGERWEVPGMPVFHVGGEDFLFLSGKPGLTPFVGAMHGRYRVQTTQKPDRPYVARDDASPLVDVRDIVTPLPAHGARAAATSTAPITPEAFESLIRTEIAQPTPPALLP